MKAKPILFSGPMVQAILEQRKTQTRRVVKPQPDYFINCYGGKPKPITGGFYGAVLTNNIEKNIKAPYQPGDILWVRETFTKIRDIETGHIDTFYAASKKDFDTVRSTYLCDDEGFDTGRPFPWKPSIHMPKAAARIFLRVTNVRVEQVQDISEADATAEGIIGAPCPNHSPICPDCMGTGWAEPPTVDFMFFWDSINAKRGHSWASNPWVWVIEFEPIDRPQGWPEVTS